MKENARIVIGVAAGVLLAAGCASTGKLAKEEANYPREKVDARALFVENCARCHGKDGRAQTFHGVMLEAQNFTDVEWRVGTSDEEIIHAIKTGPRSMPAFEGKLSGAEIEALAAYVKTFAQPQP
jgi:cbb3-type cytochrome c oxidase subunit III